MPQLTAKVPDMRVWLAAPLMQFLHARHASLQLASDDEYLSRMMVATLDKSSLTVDNLTADLAEPHAQDVVLGGPGLAALQQLLKLGVLPALYALCKRPDRQLEGLVTDASMSAQMEVCRLMAALGAEDQVAATLARSRTSAWPRRVRAWIRPSPRSADWSCSPV